MAAKTKKSEKVVSTINKVNDIKIKRGQNVWGDLVIYILVFDGSYWLHNCDVDQKRLAKMGYDVNSDESVLAYVKIYQAPIFTR